MLLKFADSHYARKVRIRLISLMLLSVFNGTAADLPEERREAASTPDMRVHIVRLRPGEDLLAGIQAYVKRHNFQAGILLTTVGSLQETRLRLANRPGATNFKGKVEIVSLVGTIDAGSAHLHLSVSDRNGRTIGGHLVDGCKIYTTAEIAIGELSGVRFSREMDRESGYEELKVSPIR